LADFAGSPLGAVGERTGIGVASYVIGGCSVPLVECPVGDGGIAGGGVAGTQ